MHTHYSFIQYGRRNRIVHLISAGLVVLGALLMAASTGLAKNLATIYTPPASNRADINLDSTWKFNKGDVTGAQNTTFDDSSWTSLSLPHTWNNLDGQDGGNNYYRGIGWYRQHYTIPSAYAGRRLFLQFDGANIVTDVYLNGTSLGEHQGGFAAFRFEITSLAVIGGDNVIAVKVNNASNADIPPLSADFTFFGGLYRDVHLLVTDPLAVTALDYGSSGVYLKETNVSASSATLQVTAKVSNSNTVSKSTTVNSVIVDAGNNIIQTLTSTQNIAANTTTNVVQTATLTNPHLWNGRTDPYLYHVYVEVRDGATVTDLVSQPLGFRYFSVDANQGFFLNGQYLDLHGVNKHQDRLNKGWAISTADMDEDYSLIMEIGATAVRMAHYQHAQHEYDLTDQDGLVVWAEIPLINNITNSTAFTTNAEQQLTELIRQNYNHPSIIFWSIANEITLQAGPDPNPLLTTLNTLVHTEDSTRLSTIASNTSDTDPSSYHTDVADFNKYFGWYGGTYNDFAPWADGIHSSHPTNKIGVSEFGAGASINFHSDTPAVNDHSEEYQNLFHEAYWQAMQTRPFLWSKFVWNMFDFAADGRNEGDTPGRNDKGLVTYDRQTRKDAFYWYKANWSTAPFVYITSRRFTPRTLAATTIKIYSNTDSVQLILNGVSQGSKTSSNHIYSWSVTLVNGSNTVQAIGTQGANTYNDTVTWTLNAPTGPNLALNKPATCSSIENTGTPCASAVDGSTSTRWSSAFSDPQWIQVDLGSTQTIGQVILRWEAAYGKAYQIQTSPDATTWTTIYSTTTGDGGVDNLTGLSGSGRYIRMYGTVRGSAYGYSLWEFEVYGPSGPTPTPAPPTATPTKTNTPVPTATNTSGPTPTSTRTNTPAPPTATPTPTNTPVPPTPTPTGGSGTNLALNKPAFSSANENSSLTPNKAVDGNLTTRWSSAFSDPQWIYVDLGSTQSIGHVILRWQNSYGKAYQIQTSPDANTWTTIYSTTTGDGGVDDLTGLSGSGRYVRMYGTVRFTQYGYSLWEFEVYN